MANNNQESTAPCPICGSTSVSLTRFLHNCRLRGGHDPEHDKDKPPIREICPECKGALYDTVSYCHGCHRLEFNGKEVSPSIPLA
jgi:hypothetical protein